jgi:hypothetical protein
LVQRKVASPLTGPDESLDRQVGPSGRSVPADRSWCAYVRAPIPRAQQLYARRVPETPSPSRFDKSAEAQSSTVPIEQSLSRPMSCRRPCASRPNSARITSHDVFRDETYTLPLPSLQEAVQCTPTRPHAEILLRELSAAGLRGATSRQPSRKAAAAAAARAGHCRRAGEGRVQAKGGRGTTGVAAPPARAARAEARTAPRRQGQRTTLGSATVRYAIASLGTVHDEIRHGSPGWR